MFYEICKSKKWNFELSVLTLSLGLSVSIKSFCNILGSNKLEAESVSKNPFLCGGSSTGNVV